MIKRFIIDTNVYTAFKVNHQGVAELFSYGERIIICPTVAAELLAGFKCGSKEKLNFDEFDTFLDSPRIHTVDINLETAEFYAQIYKNLRLKGTPIPTNDIWIAATALQNGVGLCSFDNHFNHIDGLLLHQPSNC